MKGTLRLFLTLCVAMLSMTLVQAQERTYSGTVKSAADGQVIIGANVAVVGTTQGTSTGVDGTYSIKARVGSQLTFSYLGMKSQTITVGNTTTIDVTLESEATDLEDVVVVAFGTAKKKDLTGSVGSIDSKIISSQSNSTVSKALEGAIPGVQIASISGQPGADASIRVRGLGTTQGSDGALIVIDGVASPNSNVLATLNPRDIESMVVSKDAASNSLYGARGANGVVLITTKKGKQGKARITFDAKFGVNAQGVPNYDRITDPGQYYEYAWQSIYNSVRYKDVDRIDEDGNGWKDGVMTMSDAEAREFASYYLFKYNGEDLSNDDWKKNASNGLGNYMLYRVPGAEYENGFVTNGKYLVGTDGKLNPEAELLWYDNWEDEFNKPRFRQEYNVSVSGASDKTDYFISAGYLDDPSYITGSEFNRYNARVNVNSQITSWLKAGLNMSYARRYLRQPAVRWGGYNPGTVSQNIFYWILAMTPLKPLWARDLNGDYKLDAEGNRIMDLGTGETDSPFGPTTRSYSGNTPLVLAYQDKWETTTDDISARGYVEAKFLKDFTFTANMAMDNSYAFENRYNNLLYGEAQSYPGRIRKSYTNYLTLNTQQLLNWNHSFGDHNFDVLLGHEFYKYQTNSLSGDKQMMLINGKDEFGNAVKINGVGGDRNKEALEGYFARMNYNYNNKYYVSASVRGDGSSKFKDPDKRWGVFWSVGGAWRISGENWMENATWINDLKLRASYGTMGNQNGVDRYVGYNIWNLGNSGDIKDPIMSISQGAIGNNTLTWETVKTFDVGLDFRFWDRVYGTIDYYIRNTTDMIWSRPRAVSTGIASLFENTASMRNSGIEIEIGVDIIKTPDILWSVNVNATHYKNQLTSLPEGVGSEALGGNYESGYFLRGVGLPYYNYYISKYAGVDPNTGLGMMYHTVTEETQAKYFPNNEVGDIVKTTDGSLATKYEAGDATPSLVGGFGTSFTYKNFDFSAQFAYALGGRFLNRDFVYGGISNQGFTTQVGTMWLDAWTPTNRDSNLPMRMVGGTNYGVQTASGTWTDMGLFRYNYLSVKNITIGYNLPQDLMDRWGMGGIRVYASLDNMWFVSDQKGIDPRQSLDDPSGIGPYSYPQMRSASLGISVTF